MSFEKEWVAINPKHVHLLRLFRDAIGVQEMKWEHITLRNLAKIRERMELDFAANSAATYCAILKAFLAQFADTDNIPDGFRKALSVKKTPSEHVALNEAEMELIEKYEPKTDGERDVKAQFMCEYYSLARSSDINNFTDANIDTEKCVITYVAQKTKKSAVVPLHRNFLKYFNQRGSKRSRWFYNHTIKNICKKCGITQPVRAFYRGKEQVVEKWELVGSHTARRSAATNLAKRGVPVPTIAMMMSHGQDFQMTQRYIWIDEIKLDKKGKNFFK